MKLAIQNSGRVLGGNEKWMTALAGGLMARGHDVVVSSRAGGAVEQRLRDGGFRTSPVRPGVYADLPRALRFAAWLRRERPDALLLTSWTETFWGAWAARRAGVPRVVVRLGLVRAPRRLRHTLPFRRWVDALIVNAPEIRDQFLRAVPWFPAHEVHVVLNGVQPSALDRAAARARIRAELGIGDGAILVGGAGELVRRKGFDVLLDAFARANLADARVVIAGDGSERDALRAQASGLNLTNRVTWLGRRTDVPEVLAACDVFVLGSRNEGMANVMLEAMSVGTPVVATDVSGARLALAPELDRPPAGWIVPPDDVEAMADALTEVAALLRRDPSAVRSRTDEALRRVDERFGVERMVDHAYAVLAGGANGRR